MTSSASGQYDEFRAQRVFGSLDGLRALGVTAVIWHHTAGPLKSLLPPFGGGHHGVTLFFAISGFLIVTLLLRERDRIGQINLRAFYIRRCLRILPLYYGVLALYVLLVATLEYHSPAGREFFENLPFFLTYTSNWFVLLEGRVIFYFAWSLAAEQQFYLAWPLFERYVRPSVALLLIVVLIVVVAITQEVTKASAPAPGSWHQVVISVPIAICLGVLLAHALHAERGFTRLAWAFSSRFSVLFWSAMMFLALSFKELPESCVHAAAVMVVGACVYREDHCLAAVLRNPWLAYVGAVSYAMYLLHMLVKNAVMLVGGLLHVALPFFAIFALTFAGAVLAAAVSHRYFESRFLGLKNRFQVG